MEVMDFPAAPTVAPTAALDSSHGTGFSNFTVATSARLHDLPSRLKDSRELSQNHGVINVYKYIARCMIDDIASDDLQITSRFVRCRCVCETIYLS